MMMHAANTNNSNTRLRATSSENIDPNNNDR